MYFLFSNTSGVVNIAPIKEATDLTFDVTKINELTITSPGVTQIIFLVRLGNVSS